MVCFETFFTCGLSQAKRLESRAVAVVSSLVVLLSSALERLRFGAIVFVARVVGVDGWILVEELIQLIQSMGERRDR